MSKQTELVALAETLIGQLEHEILKRWGMASGQIMLHPEQQEEFSRDMQRVDRARASLDRLRAPQ